VKIETAVDRVIRRSLPGTHFEWLRRVFRQLAASQEGIDKLQEFTCDGSCGVRGWPPNATVARAASAVLELVVS
jgi:hypothetical protein